MPVENRLGREGEGLKIALTTLNAGRLSIPALARPAPSGPEDRPRVVGRAGPVGRPVGQHEAVAGEDRVHRGHDLRDGVGRRAVVRLADAGETDIRIEAAWRSCGDRDGLADRGRGSSRSAGAELRDGGVAQGARGAGGARRAAAARRPDQPDLRGLERDHAPAHRARGGRRAPQGGWRSRLGRRRPAGQGQGRRGASGFYAKWLPQLVTGAGTVPTSYGDFGPLARHLRFVERSSRRLARQTFYGMSRWQAGMNTTSGSWAGSSTSAPSCSRWRPRAYAPTCSLEDPSHGRSAQRLADAFCGQARLRVEVLFDELWTNTDDTDRKPRRCSTVTSPGSRRASWTRARAPARGSHGGRHGRARRSRSGARCAGTSPVRLSGA